MTLTLPRTSSKLLVCISIVLLTLCLCVSANTAYAVTSEEKQAEADEIAARIDELTTQLNEAYATEEEASQKYDDAVAARDAALKQKEEAEKKIASTQERLGERATTMYTQGSISFLDVFFGVSSFQDFLTAWDAYEFINSYDSDLIDENKRAREVAQTAAEEYEEQSQIASEELERATNARVEIEETTAQLQEELEAVNEEIAILIAKEEEEAAAEEAARKAAEAAASGGSSYSGSGSGNGGTAFDSSAFDGWVIPTSYSYVSCEFGYSPITGSHNGIDLAASSGTPIYAAGPGTVTYVGWYGTGGNSVIISHGNGVQTIYMHQSQTAATVGTYVQAGDLIGYVGTTGLSTGPHLHFQLVINGTPTNPRNYFSF